MSNLAFYSKWKCKNPISLENANFFLKVTPNGLFWLQMDIEKRGSKKKIIEMDLFTL